MQKGPGRGMPAPGLPEGRSQGERPAGQVPGRLFTFAGRSSLPRLDLAHLVANLESSRMRLCQRLLRAPTGPGALGPPLLPRSERHALGRVSVHWPPAPGPSRLCGQHARARGAEADSLALCSGSASVSAPRAAFRGPHPGPGCTVPPAQRSHTNPSSLGPPP